MYEEGKRVMAWSGRLKMVGVNQLYKRTPERNLTVAACSPHVNIVASSQKKVVREMCEIS
jgi:hypothetical protein